MFLFGELRRRSVFRVAAAYVVTSWIIIQVVSALNSPLSLPGWFERVVIVLLAIGFPVALVIAWAFELTPEGIKPSHAGDGNQLTSGSKLDAVLVVALVAVAAATLWTGRSADNQVVTGKTSTGQRSIAVLPFADMSPGGDQGYFGEGIAEEFLNELARLDGLQVAARTSSFSYKDSDLDVQEIGRALNVEAVLEGSVRKDGDQIRITAQLINVDNGFHEWSETYDRAFTDIFAIQEEIATKVAGALGVRLGVGGTDSFQGAGTRNVEAYELFLRASSMPVQSASSERIRTLERVIELDPGYAAAEGSLAVTIAATMWAGDPADAQPILERALQHARRAVQLDPESASALDRLATISYPRHEWIEAQEMFERALSINESRGTYASFASMLMRTGRMDAARRNYETADALSVTSRPPATLRINVSVAQREFEEAHDIVRQRQRSRPEEWTLEIALSEGDTNAIKQAIETVAAVKPVARGLYSDVLSDFDSPESVLSILRGHYEDTGTTWPSELHEIAMLAAYFGDPEFALTVKSEEIRHTPARQGALWHPVMSEVRRLPAFKQLMRDINLAEYWREYGWPEACRPQGEDDFVCE